MEKTNRSVDSLNRPEGNSLQENYKSHDCGEEYIRQIVDGYGFYIEAWGLDAREKDDTLIYDDKMDFRLWQSSDMEELVCIIDVKSKNGKDWSGRYNYRHHRKYYGHVDNYDVPVYVVFCILDGDDVEESYLVPLHKYEQEECYSSQFRFPDNNKGVYIPVEHRHGWSLFYEECVTTMEDGGLQ